MNPLAKELNELIAQNNPHVLDMLSDLGKNLFFPKGILTQSAEAKEKAHKYNATIGIATEKGGPMYLECIQRKLSAFDPKDIFPYAPPAGKPELRKLWTEKMLREWNDLKRAEAAGALSQSEAERLARLTTDISGRSDYLRGLVSPAADLPKDFAARLGRK